MNMLIMLTNKHLLSACSWLLAVCMSLWKRRTFPRVNKNGVKTRTGASVEPPRDTTTEGAEMNGVGGGGGVGVISAASEHLLENNGEWVYEVVTALARLGVIMVYFFLCDR